MTQFRPFPMIEPPPMFPPRLLSPEEFANDLAPDALVETMIYRSSTHLTTGASKGGKSWWAYHLAMAVSAGRPFLNLKTFQANVLLVSLEMSAGMIRTRMESISEDVGLPTVSVTERFPALSVNHTSYASSTAVPPDVSAISAR